MLLLTMRFTLSYYWSLTLPPGNTTKPLVFKSLQGVMKAISGIWVRGLLLRVEYRNLYCSQEVVSLTLICLSMG